MKQTHKLTSDEKLKHWGYGEWVEEPDLVEFEHEGIQCKILRTAYPGEINGESLFGGHLCGYCFIPKDSALFAKDDIDIQVHCGITYNVYDDVMGTHQIGFDCAHYCDYCPSIEKWKKTDIEGIKIWNENGEFMKKFKIENSPLFQKTYKNIKFCIAQCKSMADQINAAKVKQ